ncbi:transcription/RNA binding protein [Ranid herpesvirus 3]|uniref:Transcription/RNA binding protein n=1 Tax=Ranid herpesvirus 3 TaxID=1987509 RepID=A0A1X9T5J9_9VIRU|nr:transcription/RNA binding protein [Ranid herpesvirus 3]ARR28973.1 transcription/RNA binding protein [Ranid herpesvirus 3]
MGWYGNLIDYPWYRPDTRSYDYYYNLYAQGNRENLHCNNQEYEQHLKNFGHLLIRIEALIQRVLKESYDMWGTKYDLNTEWVRELTKNFSGLNSLFREYQLLRSVVSIMFEKLKISDLGNWDDSARINTASQHIQLFKLASCAADIATTLESYAGRRERYRIRHADLLEMLLKDNGYATTSV